jgi:hypothetical protein
MKKFLVFVIATLTLVPFGYAQGTRHDNIALNTVVINGITVVQPIQNANITVCGGTVLPTPGTICTGLVNIFTDLALTSSLPGITNADSRGNYGFYVAAGNYIVSVSGVGLATYSYPLVAPCVNAGPCTSSTLPFLPFQITKDGFTHTLTATTTTAPRTWTLQDTSDTFVFRSTTDILINKTLDASLNTFKWSTNTAGHYLRNNGTNYVDSTIQNSDVPPTNLASTSNGGVAGLLPNANIQNPSTSVNGQTCTLGGSCTISIGSALVIRSATGGGCTTQTTSNSNCDVTLTWSGGGFADTSYFPQCSFKDTNMQASGGDGSSGEVGTIVVRTFTTTTITATLINLRSLGLTAAATTVYCTGVHN